MARPLALLAYALVALLIAFELWAAWLMLHPDVPEDYRAYYVDQTTTCLNQPVSGEYVLGTPVSFRPDGIDQARPLRVCGWDGPAGDGTHAIGQTSRLRFALPPNTSGPLLLRLEIFAITWEGQPVQRVAVRVNNTVLQTIPVPAGETITTEVTVPPDVVGTGAEALELALDYPDAIQVAPTDSDTRMRSIKLLAAQLSAAP